MKRARRQNARGLVWLAMLALLCTNARIVHAHPAPSSFANIDFTVDGAQLEQDVPLEELQSALQRTLLTEATLHTPDAVVQNHAALLRAYASAHLHATSVGGFAPWTVEVLSVTGHTADDGPRALFRFALRAPRGESSRSLRLHDEIVAHEVLSHYTLIYVRSDWSTGLDSGPARLAGTVHAGHNDITIPRTGSFWRGLRSIVRLGIEHIATGSDHLMFLFALILVAPLTAARGGWAEPRSTRATLLALVRVVTAFTIGHSITLALGALHWVFIPSAAIEAAIAISILVTAAHALRPLFPRREALVAAAFGLVHGLAFADTLAGRDLGRAQAAFTLLGFNTGIELAQLALLCLVVPWLLLLARTRAYHAFRSFGGALAALLAAGWLLERTTSWPNPTARPLAWLESHPLALLVSLALCASIARVVDRRRLRVLAATNVDRACET